MGVCQSRKGASSVSAGFSNILFLFEMPGYSRGMKESQERRKNGLSKHIVPLLYLTVVGQRTRSTYDADSGQTQTNHNFLLFTFETNHVELTVQG